MLFATVGQGARFIWMMAAGAAVGAWYLVTALLRRFIQAGFWLTLCCDLLFGLGAAAILIAALIAGSYGQARPFELLGAMCGAGLFCAGFLAPLWSLLRRLRRNLDKTLAVLAKKHPINIIFK